MKKTIIAVIAFAFLLGVMSVSAKENKEPKAVDVKIHKKQLISGEERKALDEAAKGKSAGNTISSKTFKPLATGVLGQPISSGGQRYAIVVGLANYSGTANDLCVPAAKTELENPTTTDGLAFYCQDEDALNMKTALEGFGYASINHLRDYQATRENIMSAMEALKPIVGPNDEVVFFFSGHGTSGKLLTYTDGETIDEGIYTYNDKIIWDDELKIWADSLNVNRMVFIFDTCLAGGMNDLAKNNRVLAMSSGETQNSYTYYLGGTQTDTNVFQESEGLFAHYFVKRGMINELADGSNLAKYLNTSIL